MSLLQDESTLNRLWWLVDVAVAALVDEHNGERGGGTFCLRGPSGGVLFNQRFRPPSPEKADKYDYLAGEKTYRLASHLEHILSWQSKDEALEHYQGGVRAPNGLLGGFSGFTAEEDEALVLWVFTRMGWMTEEEAGAAAQISSNQRYAALVQKFNQAENLAT